MTKLHNVYIVIQCVDYTNINDKYVYTDVLAKI